jgi:hypothetical protein
VSPKVLYRTAAILLVVFASLHTLGFAQIDPTWGVDELISQLRAHTFLAQGQSRSYWDFYIGFGYTVTGWQLFAAIVAWELSGSSAPLPLIRWGVVGSMVLTTVLSWRYFFPAPLGFSLVITACLAWAAWRVRSVSA